MAQNHGQHQEHTHHVTPMSIYVKTFGSLIALTILTVVTSYFDFGSMNLVVALLIATVKALLVMMFFMQLKYDEIGNIVAFASSFVFLAIFFGLTAADFFNRHEVIPPKVEKVAAGGVTDPRQLHIAAPELVNKGKELYAQQCVSCHGATGGGDGVAAAALNPKPRNFQSGYWKFGGAPSIIFKTLTQGSPGTAMGSFATLTVEERYALAHYVWSISKPTPAQDTDADLQAALKIAESSGGNAKSEIPIDFAMEEMAVKDQVDLPGDVKNPNHPGAYLYQTQCAQCHGTAGQGAKVVALGVNPPAYIMTQAFSQSTGSWKQSEAEFIKTVSKGLPGKAMPGMAGYSPSEWNNLFNYVRSLQ